jgi:hypothetical protein
MQSNCVICKVVSLSWDHRGHYLVACLPCAKRVYSHHKMDDHDGCLAESLSLGYYDYEADSIFAREAQKMLVALKDQCCAQCGGLHQ